MFHGVILESAGAFRPLCPLDEAEAQGALLGDDLAELRALSADGNYDFGAFRASHFHLYLSENGKYTRLAGFPLDIERRGLGKLVEERPHAKFLAGSLGTVQVERAGAMGNICIDSSPFAIKDV